PAREQHEVADERPPLLGVERGLDRLDAVREHVPEQEDQDPRRERGESGAHACARRPHAPDRKPEEDRGAGDRAEQEGLCFTHRSAASSSSSSFRKDHLTRLRGYRRYDAIAMAQGHSVDEYLETIYFLAFPIGEYRPQERGLPTLSARVAEML